MGNRQARTPLEKIDPGISLWMPTDHDGEWLQDIVNAAQGRQGLPLSEDLDAVIMFRDKGCRTGPLGVALASESSLEVSSLSDWKLDTSWWWMPAALGRSLFQAKLIALDGPDAPLLPIPLRCRVGHRRPAREAVVIRRKAIRAWQSGYTEEHL